MTTKGSGPHGLDRRLAPRYRCQVHLEIEWGSTWLKGRARDISAGGMFIETDDLLWVGAGFRARLIAEHPVWLNCSVKHVEPGRGMSVTISLPEGQSHQHFHNLLAKLAAGS